MKIVADENISYAGEAFSTVGEVVLKNGREISRSNLSDAEILIVRSVTEVNEELLKGTPVKFVGTATIGTDHLDTAYLDKAGIKHVNAAGCNSTAVAEYVLAAITKALAEKGEEPEGKTIGIIGDGNIGTKVQRIAGALGMQTIINDPPKERETGAEFYRALDEALSADVVTFHVPLNSGGPDNTIHLLNKNNIGFVKPGAILINSSRGPVVDNAALLERIRTENDIYTILDVWENEPYINRELLAAVNIATPHIAGYTLEGKVNGTVAVYEELCRFLGVPPEWQPDMPGVFNNIFAIEEKKSKTTILKGLVDRIYPIDKDTAALKDGAELTDTDFAAHFDYLRKTYALRRETANYKVVTPYGDYYKWLGEIGFRVNG